MARRRIPSSSFTFHNVPDLPVTLKLNALYHSEKFVATTFKGADDKLAAAMSRLKDLSDSEQRQVAASAFSTARKTLNVVQGTANAVERSETTVENLAASISGTVSLNSRHLSPCSNSENSHLTRGQTTRVLKGAKRIVD